MSLVINKLKNKIATRGLGGSGVLVQAFTFRVFLRAVVREEIEYHPTTGVLSQEEEIEGWCYDKAPPQDYSNIESTVITSIGGYKYNLDEGLVNSDFRGSCIGCELIDVEEKYTDKIIWNPRVEVGNYSVNGQEKRLFSNGSVCFVAESSELVFESDTWKYLLVGTSQAAIYKRDEFFVNSVYKRFELEIDEPTNKISIENFKEKQIGLNDAKDDTWESFGHVSQGHKTYLKYFPIKDLTLHGVIGREVVPLATDVDYILDSETGTISWKTDGIVAVYGKYTAIPRVDIEVIENYFSSNINLKPYLYKQASGIIEISPEEKNLHNIDLSADRNEVSVGAETRFLTAKATNKNGKTVDEIKITFHEVDEVLYEGNLKELVKTTNASGEAFARASFPFRNNSLSNFIPISEVSHNQEGSYFYVPDDVLESADLNDFYLFEVLKVDPFLGSNGIEFKQVNISAVNGVANEFEVTLSEEISLKKELYKLHRNDLKNPLNIPKETEINCFEMIYNVGNIKIDESTLDFVILNVNKNIIRIKAHSNMANNNIVGTKTIKLFLKNENEEGLGVDRLCYTVNGDPLKPSKVQFSNYNKEIHFNVKLKDNVDTTSGNGRTDGEIVSGYRIFYPKVKKFICSGIDPATGNQVFSNQVEITTTLSDKYKNELHVYNPNNDVSRLGGASYLTINPDTENTVANLRLIGV